MMRLVNLPVKMITLAVTVCFLYGLYTWKAGRGADGDAQQLNFGNVVKSRSEFTPGQETSVGAEALQVNAGNRVENSVFAPHQKAEGRIRDEQDL